MGYTRIRKIILKITPNKIKRIFEFDLLQKYKEELEFMNLSYSQEGEDLILQRIFGDKKDGFFVDVGAHHPKRFSNTYLFYKKGWTGINSDPMPGIMKTFNEIRPRDTNLEIGISSKEGELTYHIFNEPALNTFSKTEAEKKDGLRSYKIIKEKKRNVQRLDYILDKYLPENQKIDFLSVDVEGLDMQVLQSNNWEKYRPKIVLAEALENTIESLMTSELKTFMNSINYSLFAKTFNTLFFIKKEEK